MYKKCISNYTASDGDSPGILELISTGSELRPDFTIYTKLKETKREESTQERQKKDKETIH